MVLAEMQSTDGESELGGWGDTCDPDNPCFDDYWCNDDTGICEGTWCDVADDCMGDSGWGIMECIDGVCVPAYKIVGSACDDDHPCLLADRFTCNEHKQCEGDYCAAEGDLACGEGEYCHMGLDCRVLKGPGQVCEFDIECTPDLYTCDTCTNECSFGECTKHWDCGNNEMCFVGRCFSVDGFAGSLCDTSDDCHADLACDEEELICKGIECDAEKACTGYNSCELGTCYPSGEPGDLCTVDDDCRGDTVTCVGYAEAVDDKDSVVGDSPEILGKCWDNKCTQDSQCKFPEIGQEFCRYGTCV